MPGSIVRGRGSRDAEEDSPLRRPRRCRREAGPVRRAGRCRSSTRGSARSTFAVRRACGVFDVSHMGEIETEGPGAAELLQRLLTNDVSKIAVGAPSTRASAARTAACSTTSSRTGLPTSSYLTVTNAANHERDLEWFEAHAVEFNVEVRGPDRRTTRCSPCRAPRLARSSPDSPMESCRRASGPRNLSWRARRPSSAEPATPARTASSY